MNQLTFFLKIEGDTMIIYDLNDAKRAESIYFETGEAAIYTAAGICYERYRSGKSFSYFLDALSKNMRYEDITIEPVNVY